MRTTVFDLDADGTVVADVRDAPTFAAFEAWEGRRLDRVWLHVIEERGPIELQLVEIAAGGSFVMHSSPKLAFCHIVRGRGVLGLPDGRALSYSGPETYIFHPHTLHDWHDVAEDTLLAVAIVPDAEAVAR